MCRSGKQGRLKENYTFNMNTIWDAHNHWMPPEVAEATTFFKKGWSDIDELLHSLDKSGVEKALLLYPTSDAHLGMGGWSKVCAVYNEALANKVKEHPDRLIAAGILPVDLPDKMLVQKVKKVQEDGGNTGSKGHQIKWDPEKARELLLRTHTTADTFRKFGIDKIKDGKYFYIGEVFRNEAIDATHLNEFMQAEGFIIGDNLSLADLMGFIKEFYGKLGIDEIKFKVAYNPYTEPSLEALY